MKRFIRPIYFLAILLILDFLLRQGIVAYFIPFKLPAFLTAFVLFTIFAILSLVITKWFTKKENTSLSGLGITFSLKNKRDFLYGFLIGVLLWASVSISQSWLTGFSWRLETEINFLNIFLGLIFIFIADLGTEVFTRGYALTSFKNQWGGFTAITFMVFFVGLKSYTPNVNGELLFYLMLIPALHTVFFSIIYLKTKRLGGALGVHTGANFVTISLFDLRPEQSNQLIPEGIFRSNIDFYTVSITILQLPYVVMAILLSMAVYYWWKRTQARPFMK